MGEALTWGTREWNWGSAAGTGHDAAVKLRSELGSKVARTAFVNGLKRGEGTMADAKLALGLSWQVGRRSGPMCAAFEGAYDALIAGQFEEAPGGDALLAAAIAPGVHRRCLNVKLVVKPARRADFLACITANAAGTANEPRNLHYSWGEAETNVFHFQEQFVGQAGFDAHAAAPHFQAWEKFASTGPFDAEPEVVFFDALADLAVEKPPKTVCAAALASLEFLDGGF